MDVFRTENNCLKFHYDAEELWIQPWGANSFRIRATKLAEMPKENWALEMPVEDIVPKIQIEEKRASIINGKIKAVISSYGKLTIYNSKDEILLDEYLRNRLDVFADYCSALDIEAREFKPILGGDYHLSMRFVSNPEEKIYGMGQSAAISESERNRSGIGTEKFSGKCSICCFFSGIWISME